MSAMSLMRSSGVVSAYLMSRFHFVRQSFTAGKLSVVLTMVPLERIFYPSMFICILKVKSYNYNVNLCHIYSP